MRFLFVDEIVATERDYIRGRRTFAASDPMRYPAVPGGAGPVVAPGAISEAIGQLASWLCLSRNDFAARPVFLFADKIAVMGPVSVGSTVELEASIETMDEETFRFSGGARVDGVLKQTIQSCSGYFMPLVELEDPEESRRRYAALSNGGLTYDGIDGEAYPFEQLAGETLELVPGESVRTSRTFSVTEPFYADHFPRFPVTPIVMINEMIGQATKRLLPAGKTLVMQELAGIKIRSFVKPGDRVETKVRRLSSDERSLEAATEVHKDGRCILRGTYRYEIS